MYKRLVLFVVAFVLGVSFAAAAKGSTKQVNGVININTASIDELSMLPGIGKSKAEAIVSKRQASPFKSTQELTKVKGIGEKLFAKISQFVVVDGPTTAKVVKVQKPTVSSNPLAPANAANSASQKTGL